MFSVGELDRLVCLMKSRFNEDFHSGSISVMEHELRIGVRGWFRYLEGIGVSYASGGEVVGGVVVRWGEDEYFIPEDLAMKILLFGEFPPFEGGWGRVLGFSAN